jgi:membrane dipeptidase
MADLAARELPLVLTVDDVEQCIAGTRQGAILHLEGAEPVDGDLGRWYERGVRSLGIVWSRPNAYGHGVPFRFPGGPDIGPGLTERGRELVHECNELGIVVDCAHLNERGFFDVARISTAPLVVSHAGVHAICPIPRSVTDRQLDAIRDSGGLLGVVFDTAMTRADADIVADTPLETIASHIRYAADRIGVEHVALGSDFDGCHPPAALSDVTKMQALRDVLDWNDDELHALAHGNWLRVLRATWRA